MYSLDKFNGHFNYSATYFYSAGKLFELANYLNIRKTQIAEPASNQIFDYSTLHI